MLVFDPRKRIDATDSLAHEYVSPYHDPTDEPLASEKFDWSFNDADLPVETWKVMMYNEIHSEFLASFLIVNDPNLIITGFHQVGEASTFIDAIPEGPLAAPAYPTAQPNGIAV